MARITAQRVRKIRRETNLSRQEFARVLWASLETVKQWESGHRTPRGAHRRLLSLLEHGLSNRSFRSVLGRQQARDPLFILYCLLELLYGSSEVNQEFFPTHHRKSDLPMSKMPPAKIRKIRKVMEMSQHDFSRFLWVTYSTLSRWELGYATPFGLHLRILMQLEKQLTRPRLSLALRDPKSEDFTFLLYRLLKLSNKPPRN